MVAAIRERKIADKAAKSMIYGHPRARTITKVKCDLCQKEMRSDNLKVHRGGLQCRKWIDLFAYS